MVNFQDINVFIFKGFLEHEAFEAPKDSSTSVLRLPKVNH